MSHTFRRVLYVACAVLTTCDRTSNSSFPVPAPAEASPTVSSPVPALGPAPEPDSDDSYSTSSSIDSYSPSIGAFPEDVWYYTASRLVESLEVGAFSLETTYVDALLQRIESVEEFNIFITRSTDLKIREDFQDALFSDGVETRLLRGVPFAVKDNINVKNMPCTGGTPSLLHWIPPTTAPVVEILVQHGAVVTGKTNMDELARGYTGTNPYTGPSKNPYDPSRIAGGSTAGTAVSIATRTALIGLGTDTLGSGRIPAALCGICGFRPTHNRYDLSGTIPLRTALDVVAPMATSVQDIQLLDQLLVQTHRGELTACPRPVPSSLDGTRIGISSRYYFEGLHPEVDEVMDKSIDLLRNSGTQIVEVDIPDLQSLDTFVDKMASFENPRDTAMYLIQHGSYMSYLEIVEQMATPHIKEYFEVFIDPETATTFEEFIEIYTKERVHFQETFTRYFTDNDLDVILYPTVRVPAPKIGEHDKENLLRNTRFASISSFPALAVPGVTLTSSGLTTGVEFCAPQYCDEIVLKVGRFYDDLRPQLPLPKIPNVVGK